MPGRQSHPPLEMGDVADPRVLDAMARVPRDAFVPTALLDRAWEDAALPIGLGQTISQPYMVGRMTELLRLTGTGRVLEVGCGSGYQAAVLSLLAREVVTIEYHQPLAKEAADRLARLGYGNVEVLWGDGCQGYPPRAPYDGILVAAAPEAVPPALLGQLAPGGRLVIPVGKDAECQTLHLYTRMPEGGIEEERVMPVRFVPFLGRMGAGWRDK